MGSWALAWALEKGCKNAELLAVNDEDRMHAILIRLYEGFGFDIVKEVGDESSSIPDRLVWGAAGTLMKLNLNSFFSEWTPKFYALWEEAKIKRLNIDAGADSDEAAV